MEKIDLVKLLDITDLTIDRLYCLEIDHFTGNPSGYAPEGSWATKAKLYDLQKRTILQILEEVKIVSGQSAGRWRMTVYYWSGQMRPPDKTRIMGIGENFLYDYKSRGDLVLKLEPSIEFLTHDEDK